MSTHIAPRSRARIFMHWLAGVLVAVLAMGGFAAPAFAAGGSVTVSPVESGTNVNGTPVLSEGGTYAFELGYGSMDDGAVATITIPDGVTIPESALVVPTGNDAIESLVINDEGQLVVTFKDPFPTNVNQGSFGLSLTIDDVETAEERELIWNVDGEITRQTIIVTPPGETPQQTSTWSGKTAAGVSFSHSLDGDTVVIDESALDVEIPYTVTISSAEARDVTFTDTLGANLALVAGSLEGNKVVRDANGLNAVTTDLTSLPNISGASFTHSFAAEANSVYTFTYTAKIEDAAALADIRDRLQAAYDAVDEINGGDYVVELTNEVDVNGAEHTTNTTIRGNVAGMERPGVEQGFSKTADPTVVTLDERLAAGDTITDGIAVTYTLGADLTIFADFTDSHFALNRNVVIRDTLQNEASWNADADGFLRLVDQNDDEVILTAADADFGNPESEIAADAYVNTYVVDGKNLFINIGKDVTKTYTLTASATIDALPGWASNDGLYATEYRVDNNAYFVWGPEGQYTGKGASTTITVPKDLSGGVDDPTRFSKTTGGEAVRVTAGQSTLIPYIFTIGQGVGDAESSRIVDVIDHTVFDVSEETLPAIQASITGLYDWTYPLDGDTFDVSIDGDRNLVIKPNTAFPKDVPWHDSPVAPFTDTWNITLELPTHVLDGKQTIDVNNAARYEGKDSEIVYTSTSSTTATSYGDEMEVRKNVYDAVNDAFTTNLRAEIGPDGTLTQSEFIYRVEMIPHGSFSNMVFDVVDVLPEGVEFVGFVTPEHVVSGEVTPGDSFVIPGSSITATHDPATGTVTIEKGKLVVGETLPLYFKVFLTDAQANVGITNMIESVGATITPTNDYPLSLLKRDSTDETKLITDSGARFSVLADDQETVVLSDLRVVDGKIVTATGETPVVAEIGTYWLREDVAPAGYEKATALSEITVDETGGSADVVLFNTPGETVEPEKNYAIGDFTWIDTNKNGQQDEGEQVLPGVTVELIQDGEVISTTTTDDRGRYIFDELPAGEYVVKFTLTDAQSEVYRFTQQDAGDDDAIDSDADTQTGLTRTIVLNDDNAYLTHDYEWNDVLATEGIDPTWDAGVILRDYAIGDVTWIDANKDGKQDDEEQVLPGVTVELLQGDEVISTTTTDERGRYIFDELPAGEYVVKFTLTDEQKKIYAFTQQDAGDDDAIDSDADTQTGLTRTIVLNSDNVYLTHEYLWNEVLASEGIDPTWDAGVIVIVPVVPGEPEPENPAKPGTPGVNELPQTGGALPLGLAGGALVLLLAGAAFLFWRRRTV